MSRPTDWSAVGWSCDPTPGDPVVVRDGGQRYRSVAAKLQRASATLRAMEAGASCGAQSVDALLDNCEGVASQIETARARYQAAGDALVDYSYKLDQAQSTTLWALSSAGAAKADVDENTRLARQYAYWAQLADTPERADERSGYLRRERTRWEYAADAQSRVDAHSRVVNQAHDDQDRAANTAADHIEQITSNDGLNDTWWDDWGAKVVTWITDVAEIIASVAGILALLVCWIPIIGQALAGVLMLVAAVAAIVAAVGNVALAATGERTWTQAIISIVGAVLACVGLGALKGAFSGLKVAMGAWKAAGGLAGQGGIRGLSSIAIGKLSSSITGIVAAGKSMMAGVNGLFSRLRPLAVTGRAGAGSGDWMEFAYDIVKGGHGVVGQLTPTSCVSAVGEMLSQGRFTQAQLIKLLSNSNGRAYYSELPKLLGQEWRCGFPAVLRDFLGGNPVGLSLKAFGQEAHFVWAKPVGRTALQILDPWPAGIGASYKISIDVIEQFVEGIVYRI